MKVACPAYVSIFSAAAIGLLAFGHGACVSPADDGELLPLESPAWTADKSAIAARWTLVGYDGDRDLSSYCSDVRDKNPRIVNIIEGANSQAPGEHLAAVYIVGCGKGNTNYWAIIEGSVVPDPANPGVLYISGSAKVAAILADGSHVVQADNQSVFVIDVEETNTACKAQSANGSNYLESANLEVSLRVPGSHYNTAKLLQQMRPSKLEGERWVAACN